MIFDSDLHSSAAGAYGLETTRAVALTSAQGHAYTLYLAWPAGAAPVGGWPVVYMLDGETFGIAREIMRYQVGGGTTPLATPRALVGIAYPGASRRAVDYGPADEGQPHAFRRFLVDEVCPLIQRTLDVNPRQQTLMGHSIGGLFVLETLFEQFGLPQGGCFSRYVASSPSVWWRDGHLPAAANRFVARHACLPLEDPPPIALTLSAAQYDEALSPAEQALPLVERDVLAHTRRTRRMVQGNRDLAKLLQSVHGLQVGFSVFEHETHRSTWPRAIAQAMRCD